MKIGIITAMSSERRQIERLLPEPKQYKIGPFVFTTGMIGANEIILMQCGIGKVNAASGTVELIHQFAPDCVISTGVAGGIDKSLHVMDVVASKQIVHHDVWCGEGNEIGQVQDLPTFFEGNPTLLSCALSLSTESTIVAGLICSGDQFITAGEQLNKIKEQFPDGLAVDMESASIAQVCYLYKVPFISFRIISDTPGDDNNWEQYTNFWDTIADHSFKVTEAFLSAIPHTIK
jgi:adenosylhomocysteine nucleosidase